MIEELLSIVVVLLVIYLAYGAMSGERYRPAYERYRPAYERYRPAYECYR